MTAAALRRPWLFVDAIPHFGGHEAMLLRWLEELVREGSVVPRLLAREGGRLLALAPASTRIAPFPPERAQGPWRRLRNAWAEARALRRALKQERPERVVFASGALGYQMLLVVLARLWGERVLVYVPLLEPFEAMGYRAGRAKDRFVRWFYSRVPEGWVAISAEQAAQFRDWARPSGPVFVLPNTVAPAVEQAPRLVPSEVTADAPLRVLVLGRLDAVQKGLDLLLAHLQAAPCEVQDGLHVRLVGEGPYRGVIEARLRADPALARCLTLADWVPGPQAMADSDVLLLTSRFEGVPLVMLEAMALGLPVVASDLPGIRAHLARDCLFAVGDLDRAVAILQGMRDRRVRERRAAEGRARYEAAASSGAFAQAVARLVQELRAS